MAKSYGSSFNYLPLGGPQNLWELCILEYLMLRSLQVKDVGHWSVGSMESSCIFVQKLAVAVVRKAPTLLHESCELFHNIVVAHNNNASQWIGNVLYDNFIWNIRPELQKMSKIHHIMMHSPGCSESSSVPYARSWTSLWRNVQQVLSIHCLLSLDKRQNLFEFGITKGGEGLFHYPCRWPHQIVKDVVFLCSMWSFCSQICLWSLFY